jgi:hypothetical protein
VTAGSPAVCAHAAGTARVGDRQLHRILFFLVLPPLLLSALMTTDGVSTGVRLFGTVLPVRFVCLFRAATGYACPTCGMTRCFIYMSHLQLSNALRMSYSGVAVYGLFVYEALYRGFAAFLPKLPGLRLWQAAEKALIVLACALIALRFVLQFV